MALALQVRDLVVLRDDLVALTLHERPPHATVVAPVTVIEACLPGKDLPDDMLQFRHGDTEALRLTSRILRPVLDALRRLVSGDEKAREKILLLSGLSILIVERDGLSLHVHHALREKLDVAIEVLDFGHERVAGAFVLLVEIHE